MSLSDDNAILPWKSLGAITEPLTRGLQARHADTLERGAAQLETEAALKRFVAHQIRTGVSA